METNLTKFDLTTGESKVYLSLLKLGSSTVGPIVKQSKIAYSNIYEVLERLSKKGLVSYIIKEKTKHFQAAEPYHLEEYLEKKEDKIKEQKVELNKILPQLISLQNQDKEKVQAEIFTGSKAVRTAFKKLVENYDKGEWVFFYTNYEEHDEKVDEFFSSLNPHVIKPGIKYRGVSEPSYKEKSSFIKAQRKYIKMKFVNFPIPGNIDLCNNKTLITTWGETPTSFLIHSKEVHDNLKTYFEFVWNSS